MWKIVASECPVSTMASNWQHCYLAACKQFLNTVIVSGKPLSSSDIPIERGNLAAVDGRARGVRRAGKVCVVGEDLLLLVIELSTQRRRIIHRHLTKPIHVKTVQHALAVS